MAKYFGGAWEHIFPGYPMRQRTVVFLADADTQEIKDMVVYVGLRHVRRPTEEEVADVEDSLRGANEDVFDDPTAYGLAWVDAADAQDFIKNWEV